MADPGLLNRFLLMRAASRFCPGAALGERGVTRLSVEHAYVEAPAAR